MIIRKMLMNDYEKVYDLWMSCKGMGLNDVDDSESGVQCFLGRNPETCFIAVDGDNVIGVILCGHDGRRGYIYHTAVHPSFRKQGVGSALVKTTLKALENQGISKAALVVFTRNQDGNAFWEKQGFSVRTDLTYRNRALVDMTRIDT